MCLVYIKSCPHTSHNMLNGGYFGNKFECDATRYTNILCILYYVGVWNTIKLLNLLAFTVW